MINFAWSKELSVGNAILDSEHRNLIAQINSIMHMIEARDSSALSDELELLETWLVAHFNNEKLFAQSVKFDFAQHQLAHQCMLNELQDLRNELAVKNGVWTDSKAKLYCLFFHDWLIGHILGEDMQMKPVLQAHPYNFKPA